MRIKILSLAGILICITAAHNALSFEGPLVIKNSHPLYVAAGSPSLVSADPENSFAVNFSYSSTYLVAGPADWHFEIDVETAVMNLQFRRMVGESAEVSLDASLIRYGDGFMDGFMDTYHRALGMTGAYGRHDRPHNVFALNVTRNGAQVIQGAPGETELGDIMVGMKKQLFHTNATTVSVQGFLDLPAGNAGEGYGSGRTGGGIAVLMNERLPREVMLYVNAGMGFLSNLNAMQEVDLRNYYYGGAALEWRYSEKIFLNCQLIVQTSPFPTTGVRSVDDVSLMASVGGRYKLGEHSAVGGSVTEDPDTAGAPDLMAAIDYRYTF